ncbi:MAG: hypothetical protein KUG78_18140 [Kangiellaceae bacterium]|nr:hypothetical protein [Kangiellaceae bacterium]
MSSWCDYYNKEMLWVFVMPCFMRFRELGRYAVNKMNKLFIAFICSLMVVSVTIASEPPSEVPQQGYTTGILREPVFELSQVIVEVTALNRWLNSNYEKLTYEQMKGPREHLYYLIDSYVKNLYANDKRIIPEQHDLILDVLFSWAERLGVYGGALVYNSLKSPESAEMPTLMKLPDQISIDLDGDLLTISANKEGWDVKIPYYFMIWNVDDFRATNGMRMQLVALSTGAAADKSEAGRSQSTIMLVYSPDADIYEFSKFWNQAMGIDNSAEEITIDSGNRKSLHTYDAGAKLHKEIVIWREPRGVFAVAYLAMDGAYQWSRPHLLDFLRSLKVKRESPHDRLPD